MTKLTLQERLIRDGIIKEEDVVSNIKQSYDPIPTEIPIINVAFSGDLYGGFPAGITMIAGDSRTFKTLLALMCVKAHQAKFPESVCFAYDTEGSVLTDQYIASFGVDPKKVVRYLPDHVEDMKFDMIKKLKGLEKGDPVIFLVDSLGGISSKKEQTDAEDAHAVTDMQRAKGMRSFLRTVFPHFLKKDIPAMMINHVYDEIGSMYPKAIVGGGKAVIFYSNVVFLITKAQVKDGTQVVGHRFTLNIEKSRFVHEKSKFPFTVHMRDGIDPTSSLPELALETGHIISPTKGWYALPSDPENKFRKSSMDGIFWEKILNDPTFNEAIKARYQYGGDVQTGDIDVAELEGMDDE